MKCTLNHKKTIDNLKEELNASPISSKISTVEEYKEHNNVLRNEIERMKLIAAKWDNIIYRHIGSRPSVITSYTKDVSTLPETTLPIKDIDIQFNTDVTDELDELRKELGIYDTKETINSFYSSDRPQQLVEEELPKPETLKVSFEGLKEWTQDKQFQKLATEEKAKTIEQLFDSNPELANDVYSVLGFTNNKLLIPNTITYKLEDNIINMFDNDRKVGKVELFKNSKIDKNGDKWNSIYIETFKQNKGYSKYLYQIALDELNKKGIKGIISYDNQLWTPEKTISTRKNFTSEVSNDQNLIPSKEKQFDDAIKGLDKEEIEELKNDEASWYFTEVNLLSQNTITTQQKQQAQQLYSQYLESLNKSNTNPILQNNQQEQIKKFIELQERLNNKKFTEAVKSVFESSPELQQIVTLEQYTDYVARITTGIIKNPSSGEYNNSQAKDVVYHGTPNKFDKFDKSFSGTGSNNKINTEDIFFIKYKEATKTFGPNLVQALINVKNPNIIPLEEFNKNWNNRDTYNKQRKGDGIIGLESKSPQQYYNEALEEYNKDPNNRFARKPKSVEDFMEEQLSTTYVVFDPSQIHILSSKQDVQGVKEFISDSTDINNIRLDDLSLPSIDISC